MRARDLALLLISAIAIFFTLQHEGAFSFHEAWYHDFSMANPGMHESQRLPPPLVTDLNGDGRSEIVVATQDAKIQILLPHFVMGSGLHPASLLKEVSLLTSRVRVASGRQAVAMAAGFLHSRPPFSRKQVLAVVTSGWSVLCFDHNLNLLWEQSVQEDFPHGAHHKEVSVLVTNYTVTKGDNGMVIVGGSMEVQPQLLDPLEEEVYEEGVEKHRKQGVKGEALEDVTAKGGGAKEKHFSYYAFSATKGAMRWKHESQDFHRDTRMLSEKLTPQHNYRLDAQSLTARHFGEVECRDFRESVLSAMPHSWERREDTRFELVHFRKHRRRSHKKVKGDRAAAHGPSLTEGKDHDSNPVARMLGFVFHKASKPRQLKDTATLSRRQLAHANVHGHNASAHWWQPNAIVAHLKEGIEAVHLYTGRTICKLLLEAGGLHGDVNGDGVLDHVQATGARGGELLVPTGMTHALGPCKGVATSGVPVKEYLFNASICKDHQFGMFQAAEMAHSRAFGRGDGQPVEVAPPILLPRRDGKHRYRRGSHGDVIFLTSHGDLTAVESVGHHGYVRWQVSTEVEWEPSVSHTGGTGYTVGVPTLKAMPLLVHGPPQVILAAGSNIGVVYSPAGNKICEFGFSGGAIQPLMIADFNNDGLNDIIAVSEGTILGLVQVRRPGAVLFAGLLGCLIVVMSVVLIRQHFNQSRGKPRPTKSIMEAI